MAEKSCLSLPPVRHCIQTISTGVFRILHARKSFRRVEFGEVHHLLIDIQPMNPRKSSTFLSLVLKPLSIKEVKPFSVSPLLVKRKAYGLICSRPNVNIAPDANFISMPRNGQLIGFCHALRKTE